MARPVLAMVQNPLIKQILHDRVCTPYVAADAKEYDLLPSGSGGRHPLGKAVEYSCVPITVGVEGNPQHDIV